MGLLSGPHDRRGQAMVETALVLPLFITVVTGILVLGIGLFYQQQVDNAAREAARYAAIHSATAQFCPVSSWKPVQLGMLPFGTTLTADPNCDPPATGWPLMTAHARQLTFGLDPNQLHVAACWSGYTDYASGAYDAGATTVDANGSPQPNIWNECTIGGLNPLTQTSDLSCPPPATSASDDKASNLALSTLQTANRVSVYVCYVWAPPLAGFLLVPETVTLRSAISEAIQHQR